jgi:hypothetical protein
LHKIIEHKRGINTQILKNLINDENWQISNHALFIAAIEYQRKLIPILEKICHEQETLTFGMALASLIANKHKEATDRAVEYFITHPDIRELIICKLMKANAQRQLEQLTELLQRPEFEPEYFSRLLLACYNGHLGNWQTVIKLIMYPALFVKMKQANVTGFAYAESKPLYRIVSKIEDAVLSWAIHDKWGHGAKKSLITLTIC